jgi:membrane protease YdiL (CAAX protease family)
MDFLVYYAPLLATLAASLAVFAVLQRLFRPAPVSVTFRSARMEVAVSVVLYLMLFAFVLFAFGRGGSAAASPEPAGPADYTFPQALMQLLANAIIVLPFGIALLIRRQGLKTIGISGQNLALSIAGGVIASVIAALILGQATGYSWLSPATAFMLIAQLGVGVSEEAIFRGYLLTRFSAAFRRSVAEVITALMFALVHIPQRLSGGASASEVVIDLAVLFLWGWVFNVIMRRTGNIAGLALLHAVINVAGG